MISQITDKIIPKAIEWQNRPLHTVYPIVFIDCVHYNVRSDNMVAKKAAHEVLGIWIGENETSKFWLSVLTDLKTRGVKDILIVCSDGLTGLKQAIESAFPPSIQQALSNLDECEEKWKDKYPYALKPWRDNWSEICSMFNYVPELRKIMYTTNAIESLNSAFRKFTKTKTVFPTDESLFKSLYLAQDKISDKWNVPYAHWGVIYSSLQIVFEGRL